MPRTTSPTPEFFVVGEPPPGRFIVSPTDEHGTRQRVFTSNLDIADRFSSAEGAEAYRTMLLGLTAPWTELGVEAPSQPPTDLKVIGIFYTFETADIV